MPFFIFLFLAEAVQKLDALQMILLKEAKYSEPNYFFMQTALKYKNTYMTDKHDNLFLTVDSLIALNNIITGSQYIGLKYVNVKLAGYNKIYMDKSLLEPALYRLTDQFNNRKLSHKEFCTIFLDNIHPF